MSGLVQLDAGKTVGGDFRVIEPLKHGGMGSVYVVEQLQTGARRALKLMHPQLVQDPKFRKRFEQEARIGAQIPSEHVVQVIAAGVDSQSGTAWLVMELLEGEDLDTTLRRRGQLPQAEATEVLGQLCHALAAAHSVGIVHRDLKPANIFLAVARRRGVPFTVKVLDFGIAKIVAEANTQATEAVGSPMWMAPEQTTQDHEILPATDVWALGLLTFRLLTGRYYWKAPNKPGATTAMLFREILIEPLPSAAQRAAEHGVAGLPKGFDSWFGRCVAREPQARFANAGEAFNHLEKILVAPKPVQVPAPAPDMLVWKDSKEPQKPRRRDSEESVNRASSPRASDPAAKKTPTSKSEVLSPVDMPPAREGRAPLRTDIERKAESTSQVPFHQLDEQIQRASRPPGLMNEEVDERASTPPDLEEVMSAPDTVPARGNAALERAVARQGHAKSNPPPEVAEAKPRRSDPGPPPRQRVSEPPDLSPGRTSDPPTKKAADIPAKPAPAAETKEPPKAKPAEPAAAAAPARSFVVKPPEPKPVEAKEPPKAKPVEPPPKPVETKEAPKAKPAEPAARPPIARLRDIEPDEPTEPARPRLNLGEPPPPPVEVKVKETPPPKPVEAKPAEPKPTEAKPAEPPAKPVEAKEAPKPRPAPVEREPLSIAKDALLSPVERAPLTRAPSSVAAASTSVPTSVEKAPFSPLLVEPKPAAIPSETDSGLGETSGVANTSPDVTGVIKPEKKLARIGAVAAAAFVALLLAVIGIRSYQKGQLEHVCETSVGAGDGAAARMEACNNLCAAGSAIHCIAQGDLLLSPAAGTPGNKDGAMAAYKAACDLGSEPGCAKVKEISGASSPTAPPTAPTAPTSPTGDPIDIDAESLPVKHIAVMFRTQGAPPSITRTKEQAQARALEAMNKVKKGAKFEDVMREYTDDAPSKSRGGAPDAQMLGKLFGMAETMKANDVIMVLTSVGYHVLLRTTYPFGSAGDPNPNRRPDSPTPDSSTSSTATTAPSTQPSTQPSTHASTQPSTQPSTAPSGQPSAPTTATAAAMDYNAMKQQLEPRVYSGSASLEEMRLLRAVCISLGDMQCKSKAQAAIAAKQAAPPPPAP